MYDKFVSELTGNTYHIIYGKEEDIAKEIFKRFNVEIDMTDHMGGLLEVKETGKLIFVFDSEHKEELSMTIIHEALHAVFCELRHMAGEIEINNTIEETMCYMQGTFINKLKTILDKFIKKETNK